jgi:general stress protein 26
MPELTSFAEIETEFIQRAHAMVWCSMATVDTRNRLRSRILHPIWEGAVGWASSRPHSLKAKHLAHNPYVTLAYIADIEKPVYADCKAEWVEGATARQHVWDLFKTTAPPAGFDLAKIFNSVDDPEFGVLKFTPWRIELYDVTNIANRRVWIATDERTTP